MTEHKHSASSTAPRGCLECKRLRKLTHVKTRLRQLNGTADPGIAASFSRAIIKDLRDAGLSDGEIARRSGLGKRTISRLVTHKGTHTRIETYEALKRVRRERHSLPAVRREGTVPADRARRVIEGLMFRGWPGSWVAEQLGADKDYVSRVLRGDIKMISAGREAELVALAHEYGDVESDRQYAKKTKLLAEARGYVSVVSWDDLL